MFQLAPTSPANHSVNKKSQSHYLFIQKIIFIEQKTLESDQQIVSVLHISVDYYFFLYFSFLFFFLSKRKTKRAKRDTTTPDGLTSINFPTPLWPCGGFHCRKKLWKKIELKIWRQRSFKSVLCNLITTLRSQFNDNWMSRRHFFKHGNNICSRNGFRFQVFRCQWDSSIMQSELAFSKVFLQLFCASDASMVNWNVERKHEKFNGFGAGNGNVWWWIGRDFEEGRDWKLILKSWESHEID